MLYVLREKERSCLDMAMTSRIDSGSIMSSVDCGLVSDTGEKVTVP